MIQYEVINFIKQRSLIEQNDKVLACVSGGPDSVFMLYCLKFLRQMLPFKLFAFHFNHGLREDSEHDEKFVRQLCAFWGVTLIVIRGADVKKTSVKRRMGIEEAARYERYNAIDRLVDKERFTKVALAHTMDDDVETFLMRILKGGALEGLKGIPERRGYIIRPLIRTRKKKILDFLRDKNIPFVVDKTNLDVKFLRNWIRHELIPFIENKNPSFIETACGLIDNLKDENDFMERYTEEIMNELDYKFCKDSEILILDIKKLIKYHRAVIKRIIVRFLFRYFYPGRSSVVSSDHIEAILNIMRDTKGSKYIFLPQGVKVLREYDLLKMGRFNTSKSQENEVLVFEDGIYQLGDSLFSFKTIELPSIEGLGIFCAAFSSEKISYPLVLRYRKPGDRIFIKGVGNRKLKKLFIDMKIPRYDRGKIPILCDTEGNVLWIVGVKQRMDVIPDIGERAIFVELIDKR